MAELSLKGPFEPRRASTRLREMLVDYLSTTSPAAGTPFYSDNELVEMSGLSRKSVRKAMDELQREGWVERQIGRGSFVGPRVHVKLSASPVVRDSTGARRIVRLAVLAYGLTAGAPDWYSQGVLAGVDESAIEQGVSIELIGSHTVDVSILTQRLAQSRPDVLVVMPSTSRHAFMIGEAQRMGIPCLLTGTRMLDLELPTVCEDGVQGAAMAVKHLVEKGHRRIGLIQRPDSAPWVFKRREGYVQGHADCGIDLDERLVLWLAFDEGQQNVERFQAYLDREKPSALVFGSAWHLRTLGPLVRAGKIRIPQDLSIVTFDQHYSDHLAYLGLRPTVVELPLREMGKRLARMARDIIENKPVPTATFLPCDLVEGDSVARYGV